MTEAQKLALVGITAAALGIAGGYAAFKALAEDDDRPPIIVKGGTLDIESGLSADRPGVAWKVKGNPSDKTWEPDQPTGKPLKALQLYWDLGTLDSGAPCEPTVVDEVRVVYDPDDAGGTAASTYYVEVERGGGKRVPKARGELNWTSAAPNKLTAPGESKTIVSVTGYYGGAEKIKCNKPARAFIEAFR